MQFETDNGVYRCNKYELSNLVIRGEKFARERSGQSVSLLNHLKQGCYRGTVSCNVSSIKFAVFKSLPNCVLFVKPEL